MGIPDDQLRQLRRLVLSWATRWGADDDDAEDIAQEVLLKVVRASDRFRGESRLSSWTYRIARNVQVSLARRSRSRDRAEGRFIAGRTLVSVGQEERLLAGITVHRLVRRWIRAGTVSRTDLRLIDMTVVQGITSIETAARMGCRPGTVRSRVSKALARVREESEAAA